MKKILLTMVIVLGFLNSNAQEAIDLGIGVRWADSNLRTTMSSVDGDYYAWGEIEAKETYSWNNYFDVAELKPTLKFKEFNHDATIERTKYDAVRNKYKAPWRMPTIDDWTKLRNKCKIEITESGDAIVTGPNGKSIIFPQMNAKSENGLDASQFKNAIYWTSQGFENENAQAIEFVRKGDSSTEGDICTRKVNKYIGLQIRPVIDYTEDGVYVEDVTKDIDLTVSDPSVDINKTYWVAEEMPKFPGDIWTFIKKNMNYPIVALENGIKGKVVVEFIVERDGSITNIKAVKCPEPSLKEEAERLIRIMPKWIPAREKGVVVRLKYLVPINFSY